MVRTAIPEPRSPGTRPGIDAVAAGRLRKLVTAARRPVAADSVIAFRILFGLLVVFSTARFVGRGWVDTLYLAPRNHLHYRWFGWVQPWPPALMYLHLLAVAAAGLAIAVGYRHRLAAVVFVVLFGYVEAIDAALYLNHYWFMTLTALVLALLPVNHHWSVDAASGRVVSRDRVAAWMVWTLRAQVAVVYVFAGLAKLNPDWLLRAQPMSLWLASRTSVGLIGPVLGLPFGAHGASWAGAFFDCTIVGWLLWRRSRPWAYPALVVFHLTTGALFQIGVFPWVMIALTTVFFEPNWPSRLVRSNLTSPSTEAGMAASGGRLAVAALALLAAVQLVVPLRHYAIDSNVRWSEEGYYLSWRVMLTDKTGIVDYNVTDTATGRSWTVKPDLVLTDWQQTQASTRPDLIHATALLIARYYADQGRTVEVRADGWVSMNGRTAARMVDPTVDLAAHGRGRVPDGWILPMPTVED